MTDDFSNYPESLNEVRANADESAEEWTPRDVLVSILRDIDSGMAVDKLIVVYTRPEEEHEPVYYRVSAKALSSCLGMLETAKLLVFDRGRYE